MTRHLAAAVWAVACLPVTLAAAAPAPYDLEIALEFRGGSGDEGLRVELELQLASQLRHAACFRSVELHAPDPAGRPTPDAGTLRLDVTVDELFEETVYDTSIADRADPTASPGLEMAHTARLRLALHVALEHPASGRTLRSRRIHGQGVHRPLVPGEDARYVALRDASAEAARSVRGFACKGGPKRLRKELGSAGAH